MKSCSENISNVGGDVRKVFIAKRCNKEGRSYGFVWFKGVSDARELEVKSIKFCALKEL